MAARMTSSRVNNPHGGGYPPSALHHAAMYAASRWNPTAMWDVCWVAADTGGNAIKLLILCSTDSEWWLWRAAFQLVDIASIKHTAERRHHNGHYRTIQDWERWRWTQVMKTQMNKLIASSCTCNLHLTNQASCINWSSTKLGFKCVVAKY